MADTSRDQIPASDSVQQDRILTYASRETHHYVSHDEGDSKESQIVMASLNCSSKARDEQINRSISEIIAYESNGQNDPRAAKLWVLRCHDGNFVVVARNKKIDEEKSGFSREDYTRLTITQPSKAKIEKELASSRSVKRKIRKMMATRHFADAQQRQDFYDNALNHLVDKEFEALDYAHKALQYVNQRNILPRDDSKKVNVSDKEEYNKSIKKIYDDLLDIKSEYLKERVKSSKRRYAFLNLVFNPLVTFAGMMFGCLGLFAKAGESYAWLVTHAFLGIPFITMVPLMMLLIAGYFLRRFVKNVFKEKIVHKVLDSTLPDNLKYFLKASIEFVFTPLAAMGMYVALASLVCAMPHFVGIALFGLSPALTFTLITVLASAVFFGIESFCKQYMFISETFERKKDDKPMDLKKSNQRRVDLVKYGTAGTLPGRVFNAFLNSAKFFVIDFQRYFSIPLDATTFLANSIWGVFAASTMYTHIKTTFYFVFRKGNKKVGRSDAGVSVDVADKVGQEKIGEFISEWTQQQLVRQYYNSDGHTSRNYKLPAMNLVSDTELDAHRNSKDIRKADAYLRENTPDKEMTASQNRLVAIRLMTKRRMRKESLKRRFLIVRNKEASVYRVGVYGGYTAPEISRTLLIKLIGLTNTDLESQLPPNFYRKGSGDLEQGYVAEYRAAYREKNLRKLIERDFSTNGNGYFDLQEDNSHLNKIEAKISRLVERNDNDALMSYLTEIVTKHYGTGNRIAALKSKFEHAATADEEIASYFQSEVVKITNLDGKPQELKTLKDKRQVLLDMFDEMYKKQSFSSRAYMEKRKSQLTSAIDLISNYQQKMPFDNVSFYRYIKSHREALLLDHKDQLKESPQREQERMVTEAFERLVLSSVTGNIAIDATTVLKWDLERSRVKCTVGETAKDSHCHNEHGVVVDYPGISNFIENLREYLDGEKSGNDYEYLKSTVKDISLDFDVLRWSRFTERSEQTIKDLKELFDILKYNSDSCNLFNRRLNESCISEDFHLGVKVLAEVTECQKIASLEANKSFGLLSSLIELYDDVIPENTFLSTLRTRLLGELPEDAEPLRTINDSMERLLEEYTKFKVVDFIRFFNDKNNTPEMIDLRFKYFLGEENETRTSVNQISLEPKLPKDSLFYDVATTFRKAYQELQIGTKFEHADLKTKQERFDGLKEKLDKLVEKCEFLKESNDGARSFNEKAVKNASKVGLKLELKGFHVDYIHQPHPDSSSDTPRLTNHYEFKELSDQHKIRGIMKKVYLMMRQINEHMGVVRESVKDYQKELKKIEKSVGEFSDKDNKQISQLIENQVSKPNKKKSEGSGQDSELPVNPLSEHNKTLLRYFLLHAYFKLRHDYDTDQIKHMLESIGVFFYSYFDIEDRINQAKKSSPHKDLDALVKDAHIELLSKNVIDCTMKEYELSLSESYKALPLIFTSRNDLMPLAEHCHYYRSNYLFKLLERAYNFVTGGSKRYVAEGSVDRDWGDFKRKMYIGVEVFLKFFSDYLCPALMSILTLAQTFAFFSSPLGYAWAFATSISYFFVTQMKHKVDEKGGHKDDVTSLQDKVFGIVSNPLLLLLSTPIVAVTLANQVLSKVIQGLTLGRLKFSPLYWISAGLIPYSWGDCGRKIRWIDKKLTKFVGLLRKIAKRACVWLYEKVTGREFHYSEKSFAFIFMAALVIFNLINLTSVGPGCWIAAHLLLTSSQYLASLSVVLLQLIPLYISACTVLKIGLENLAFLKRTLDKAPLAMEKFKPILDFFNFSKKRMKSGMQELVKNHFELHKAGEGNEALVEGAGANRLQALNNEIKTVRDYLDKNKENPATSTPRKTPSPRLHRPSSVASCRPTVVGDLRRVGMTYSVSSPNLTLFVDRDPPVRSRTEDGPDLPLNTARASYA